ncbi:MAG TPA: hypothetical protein VJT67_02695 [Longimicrobiaceae bacterium]|nr:hypothetical protein [Longimicrobiaceae bacterium]
MKKLHLAIDDLVVDSFSVEPIHHGQRGTVRAAQNTRDPWTVPLADTSDRGTCGAVTCQNGCATGDCYGLTGVASCELGCTEAWPCGFTQSCNGGDDTCI